MSKLKLYPFKAEDFSELDLRDREREMIDSFPQAKEAMHIIEEECSALTIKHGDLVLGVVGYSYPNPWTMELFLLPSRELPKHALAFARLMRYYREEVIDKYNWHRLQIISPSDELHKRWVRFLKLDYEGTLKGYGWDKLDYDIWAITR